MCVSDTPGPGSRCGRSSAEDAEREISRCPIVAQRTWQIIHTIDIAPIGIIRLSYVYIYIYIYLGARRCGKCHFVRNLLFGWFAATKHTQNKKQQKMNAKDAQGWRILLRCCVSSLLLRAEHCGTRVCLRNGHTLTIPPVCVCL